MADIELTTGVVRQGASDALTVADDVGTAVGAAAAALPADAFGLMCSPLFVPAYALLGGAVGAAMTATGARTQGAALALREAADLMDETDSGIAAGARALAGGRWRRWKRCERGPSGGRPAGDDVGGLGAAAGRGRLAGRRRAGSRSWVD